ncbi:hypothetical protein TNCV_3001991 [Trichonephila clavipes]|nr:hypothetical protein TNCV_3001991 [Trichonephila clavipes]
MSARYYMSDCDHGRAVGRLEAGQTVITVVAAMGVLKSVILRLKKTPDGGYSLRKHARGRGRNTTPLEDRYVALVAKRSRNFPPGEIGANLASAISMHGSARTISRRLNQVCVYESLFDASHFNHAFAERKYAGGKEHVGWDHQN